MTFFFISTSMKFSFGKKLAESFSFKNRMYAYDPYTAHDGIWN